MITPPGIQQVPVRLRFWCLACRSPLFKKLINVTAVPEFTASETTTSWVSSKRHSLWWYFCARVPQHSKTIPKGFNLRMPIFVFLWMITWMFTDDLIFCFHETQFKVGTWARPESRVVGYQLMCWVQGTRWTQIKSIGGSYRSEAPWIAAWRIAPRGWMATLQKCRIWNRGVWKRKGCCCIVAYCLPRCRMHLQAIASNK